MRSAAPLLLLSTLALPVLLAPRAHAAEAEAREAARSAGCRADKVKVLRQVVGPDPETTYQITCQEDKNLSVLVRCAGRTCYVLR